MNTIQLLNTKAFYIYNVEKFKIDTGSEISYLVFRIAGYRSTN